MPDVSFRRDLLPLRGVSGSAGRPSTRSVTVVAHMPEGGRLLDACDETRAPVSFSCRSATCGTCLVRVEVGGELLEPPGREETELLGALSLARTHRLACKAVARAEPGTLILACEGPPPGP